MTTEQQQAAVKLATLIRRSCSDNEATAHPFWYIAVKGGAVQRGRNVFIRGFWFSRDHAERHLRNHAYRYPKNAFVYCESGHDSVDVIAMYKAADDVLREASA